MKTSSEQKFDALIKETFQAILKPLGFKKKGNNFYLRGNGIGKIINLQKSSFYSKEHIHFTINTGIFSPEFWKGYYTYSNKIPDYPTEPECVIRRRIGKLLNTRDTWYDIRESTNIEELKKLQEYNLKEIILPYFNKFNTKEEILAGLVNGDASSPPLARLIMLGELNRISEAKEEMNRLLADEKNIYLKNSIILTATQYGLA